MAKEDRVLLESIAHDMGVAFSDLAELSDSELVDTIVGGYIYDKSAIQT